jgi:hypothetical protein
LAGSAGYYIICRDCGYAHQVIEMIS